MSAASLHDVTAEAPEAVPSSNQSHFGGEGSSLFDVELLVVPAEAQDRAVGASAVRQRARSSVVIPAMAVATRRESCRRPRPHHRPSVPSLVCSGW